MGTSSTPGPKRGEPADGFRVREYWIVNLQEETVEVFRDPDPPKERYPRRPHLYGGETLPSTAVPGIELAVDRLFA